MQWLSKKGFLELWALLGTNGAGIGSRQVLRRLGRSACASDHRLTTLAAVTSSLATFDKALSALPKEDAQQEEDLDNFMDHLYDKMDEGKEQPQARVAEAGEQHADDLVGDHVQRAASF